MKKLLSVVLAVLMVMSLATYAVSAAITPTDGWYDSFTGSVYTIGSAEDLMAFAASTDTFEGKTVLLTADISLNDGDAATWGTTAPANKWVSKGTFKGTFDGQGHTISGLYGLSFITALSGTIKNLSVKNSYFSGTGNVSAFAGTTPGASKFINCYTNAIINVDGNNGGGFTGDGKGQANSYTSCWFDGVVNCTARYASGFVGNQNSGNNTFTDCLNTGTVDAAGSDPIDAGISGAIYNGVNTFTNCVNLGKINGGAGFGMTCRSNKNSECTYTNCYVLAGSAAKPESEASTEETAGTKWLAADADLSALATTLGSAWAVKDGKLVLKLEVSNDYILIDEWADLTAWAANGSNDAGKTVFLLKDITAPADATWTAKAEFAGTFDGCGNSISGLKGAQGLIAKMTAGEIKDLSIDATISATATAVAIFVGKMEGDIKLTNCYAGGSVTSTKNNVAAFIGDGTKQYTATFNGCWNDADVNTSERYASGFVGNQESCTVVINDSLNTGSVNGDATNGNQGGFSESVYNGKLTITNALNLGTITYDKAAPKTGFAFTRTLRRGSVTVLTNCFNLTGAADSNTYELQAADATNANATLNGKDLNATADELAAIVTDITAADYETTLTALGANWGKFYTDYDNFFPVPAAFVNERPASTEAAKIGTWEELVAWAQDSYDGDAKTYELTADITMPADATWTAKAAFAGTFDGKGHSIIGLKGTQGLIAELLGATVKNLNIVDAEITGGSVIGALAGNSKGETLLENVYVKATVNTTGNHVAIIVGNQSNGIFTAKNVWSDGSIISTAGTGYVSGILGNQQSNAAVFENCLNTGLVVTAGSHVSGISNAVYNGSIDAKNCVNLGTIKTVNDKTDAVAGSAIAHCIEAAGTTKFVNCFGLEGASGSMNPADDRRSEKEAEGTIKSIKASDYNATLTTLGADWGKYWTSDSEFIPVPAVFKNEQPVDPNKITISTWEELVAWAADTSNNADKTV
ncbi:MAG: hypothetical protein E7646_03865, partial [Ruminococcaceae bacterium]|nr:hypothetical protein [Oscillospiraceae bacterium]